MAESGYLVLADITGYTGFMTDSELAHAQEIMESLIDTIIDHLHAPLVLYKLEGDAVVAYSLDEDAMQGQSLLESVEHLYYAFHHELESSDRNTTCQCKACANMHSLDLKAVVHHGEFGLQKVRKTNQVELIGNDVILAHRLLKNKIPEKTGVSAYAFFSDAAAQKMQLNDFTESMVEHKENYEHIGEVQGYVYDLKPAWAKERERRRVFISHNQAIVTPEAEFDVPQSIAWDYVTAPESMQVYLHADIVNVSEKKKGRVDVGTSYHCVHGNQTSQFFILDRNPFSYFTLDADFFFGLVVRYTVHFVPETPTKTLVKFNITWADHDKFQHKLILGVFGKMLMRFFAQAILKNLNDIQGMIEQDKQSGRMKMRMIAAEPQPMD